MRRVLVEHIRTGDRIGQDVYARPDALPLLRAGVRVSGSYRTSLARAGVTSVWVDDELSEGIDPLDVLTEETRQRASLAVQDLFSDAAQSLATGAMLPEETITEVAKVVGLIVTEVGSDINAALAIDDLANADGYMLKHSLAVTTFGLSLGLRVMQRFGWSDAREDRRFSGVKERLPPLGAGLLVQDIGKLAVPAEILRKSGPLTDEEWIAMKAHPMEGLRILQHTTISALSRAVVRSHHERWDGSGYPAGHSGLEIHQFARIAAVADAFDALTSERHHCRAWPVHKAWKFIVDRSGRDFDPQVVDVFRTSVAPYPPGTGVVLSDGTCGIVKEARQDFVTLPIVRVVLDSSGASIRPQEINLATSPELTIVSTEFNPWATQGG